ncbi:MAG: PorV/PorQ family protein, partial [Candidatus Krumholzibacteria bacterium]|nr:PorV/PorQ family protein [Candidatus Krumholzibacteria bacterium]
MNTSSTTTAQRFAITCLLILTVSGSSLQGAEGPGATGASYLTLPVSAKSIAMGEIGAALPEAPFSWTINPGALCNLDGTGAGVFHAEWILDTRYNNAFLHYRFNPKFVIGIGTIFTYRPEIQGYDELGIETESLKANNYQILAGLGVSPVPSLTLGANVKIFNEKLGDCSAGGTAFDLGAFYKVQNPDVSLGVSVRNIGGDISFEEIDEPLPLTVNFGMSYLVSPDIGNSTMLLAFDLIKPRYDGLYLAGGIELTVHEMIAFRVGYNDNEDRPGNGLTAGG